MKRRKESAAWKKPSRPSRKQMWGGFSNPPPPRSMTERIFTIGHSTRDLADFIALLRENGVQRLADIRRYPGSRRYPHFSSESLQLSLPAEGIEYIHMPELGGRRKPLPDSRNTAWRNEQFRAYADHMATAEFRDAIDH